MTFVSVMCLLSTAFVNIVYTVHHPHNQSNRDNMYIWVMWDTKSCYLNLKSEYSSGTTH